MTRASSSVRGGVAAAQRPVRAARTFCEWSELRLRRNACGVPLSTLEFRRSTVRLRRNEVRFSRNALRFERHVGASGGEAVRSKAQRTIEGMGRNGDPNDSFLASLYLCKRKRGPFCQETILFGSGARWDSRCVRILRSPAHLTIEAVKALSRNGVAQEPPGSSASPHGRSGGGSNPTQSVDCAVAAVGFGGSPHDCMSRADEKRLFARTLLETSNPSGQPRAVCPLLG